MEAKPMHENEALILREGWRLFQQKGYRGVSLDELCRQCNLTKPTLYYYFGDKENLFVQVLRHQLGGFHASIEAPGSLAEKLERFAAAILVSFQTEYTALLRDREHIKNPENRQAIRQAFHTELFGPLRALMQTGMDSGELRPAGADKLSLIFLGIINNFINRASDMNTTNAVLAAELTDYFLKGALHHE